MDTTMLIDIDRLPQEGLRLSRDFEFLSLDLVEEDAVFLEPAHADLTVRLAGEEVLVQGEITARISFVCARCLTPFEYPRGQPVRPRLPARGDRRLRRRDCPTTRWTRCTTPAGRSTCAPSSSSSST
ncbi:MAG: hypothetical protein MZU79_05005 [Anaerotruncus sp.]|nr:hypothetical protein [Anaerotruncus sp.]